jgi:hypothetical protein
MEILIAIVFYLLPLAIIYRLIHEYNNYRRFKSPPQRFYWLVDSYIPEKIYYTPQRILDYVEKENNKQLIGNPPYKKD